MKQGIGYTVIAAIVMQMTGCASTPPEPEALSPQMQKLYEEEARKVMKGPVELTISYCGSQAEIPSRSKVVNFGKNAVFEETDSVGYELLVNAIGFDGKVRISISANWRDNSYKGLSHLSKSYYESMITVDGKASKETVIPINEEESCFSVTANSLQAK